MRIAGMGSGQELVVGFLPWFILALSTAHPGVRV